MAEYLTRAYLGYLNDPPDSEYQRGHLAALLEVGKQINLQFTDEWRNAKKLTERQHNDTSRT